jgi:ELWxxDGT repeat protein
VLWKSDGTPLGTVEIMPTDGSYSLPSNLSVSGGTLYFLSYNPNVNQNELWKSDGTPGGTEEVTPASGSFYNAGDLTDVGGMLYFSAYDPNVNQYELWKSNGTPGGTVEVTPATGSFYGPNQLTDVGGTLYFSAYDPSLGHTELWKSDGTSPGTVEATNAVIPNSSYPLELTAASTLDQDTGEQAALTLAVGNADFGATAAAAVPFTIAGLDPEDAGTVTFTDGNNTVMVPVTGDQTSYTANLTSLADGTITSSLQVSTDPAGNSFAPVSASVLTTLVAFNLADGANLRGSLITDANGDLFGTTANGGGTVFEIVKNGSSYASTPTTLVNFNNGFSGGPEGSLIADANGDLFGTHFGTFGGPDYGTVFEIMKTSTGYASTPTTLVSFDATDGANPSSTCERN